MACKVQFVHCFITHPLRQSINEVTVVHTHHWLQNWRFCISAPHLAIFCALFAPLRRPNTKIWLAEYNFYTVLFTYPLWKSIYKVTVFQTHHWLQNWWFCIFAPCLATFLALFAPLRGRNSEIWFERYSFCIVLFTRPLRKSIYEVPVLQTHHWLHNWRFCIFGPRLAIFLALFASLRGLNTKIWLAKYTFCIVLFTYLLRQSIYVVTVLQTHHWL